MPRRAGSDKVKAPGRACGAVRICTLVAVCTAWMWVGMRVVVTYQARQASTEASRHRGMTARPPARWAAMRTYTSNRAHPPPPPLHSTRRQVHAAQPIQTHLTSHISHLTSQSHILAMYGNPSHSIPIATAHVRTVPRSRTLCHQGIDVGRYPEPHSQSQRTQTRGKERSSDGVSGVSGVCCACLTRAALDVYDLPYLPYHSLGVPHSIPYLPYLTA
ncbi:uncharacterized protein K452DRAFT_306177 [Aplosporella prunicola CBS 121167]|uniref:Uncharacterized protein n=1 Tax=Aplosporella prunicola CBS 121167 TaxID=1176127 RepID=A0A6A6BMJ0_9PEZI|nr:uncharacterized protein K452DRAFT_306177 [Aplosporella prunicola CBS 121167]KAF2145276.1 hypothetical protein K452DRAFT_306177 [Aplosporella prunicola CBS 121167]